MANFLWGLIIILSGTAVIYFHNELYQLFWPIQRAEKNLGDSRQVYILFWSFLIIVGVLMRFGLGSDPTNTSNMKLWVLYDAIKIKI